MPEFAALALAPPVCVAGLVRAGGGGAADEVTGTTEEVRVLVLVLVLVFVASDGLEGGLLATGGTDTCGTGVEATGGAAGTDGTAGGGVPVGAWIWPSPI